MRRFSRVGLWLALLALASSDAAAFETRPRVWDATVPPPDCSGNNRVLRGPSPGPIADEICDAWGGYQRGCSGWTTGFESPHDGGMTYYDVNGIPAYYTFGCVNAPGPLPYDTDYIEDLALRPKNRGPTNACVANPINLGSETKLEMLPLYLGRAGGGLDLVLTYNSNTDDPSKAFGRMWRHSYERVISAVGQSQPRLAMAWRQDGKVFAYSESGGAWLADSDVFLRLEATLDGNGALTGWILTDDEDGSVERYDAAGVLQSIRDRNGLTTSLSYSDPSTPPSVAPRPGLLIRVEDPYGRALGFTYDAASHVVSMTDPAGGSFAFTYDASGNLTRATFPSNDARTFHYNEAAHNGGRSRAWLLTGITDENGARFATFGYDDAGRAVHSEHAGAAGAANLSYNYFPNQVSNGGLYDQTVVDALGTSRSYVITAAVGRALIRSITEPCPGCGGSRTMTQLYDGNGNLTSRTRFGGALTSYAYDTARGLETSRVEASGTPARRTVETLWHDTLRRPLSVTVRSAAGVALRVQSFDWDSAGNLLSETTTDPIGGAARTTAYTYDGAGRVLSVDGPRTDVSDVTRYAYYGDTAACATTNGGHATGCRGALASVENALGQVTRYPSYDAHGKPTAIVDANGTTTTLAYDARQRLIARTTAGVTTSFDYDGVGQIIRVTLGDGSYIDYAYDSAHRLIALMDNLGDRIERTLDAAGNLLAVETYDAQGDLVETQRRAWDSVGRLIQETRAGGATTRFSYDAADNRTGLTTPDGRSYARTFDPLRRLLTETAPDGTPTQSATWDALDRRTSLSLPRGVTLSTTEDALGLLQATTDPDRGELTHRRDEAGNLIERRDAAGRRVQYQYDALNRLTRIAGSDGSESLLTYDQGSFGVGQLTGVVDASGTRTFEYDARGRLVRDARAIPTAGGTLSLATAYQYDNADRLTAITYPSGRVVTYARNSAGHFSGVTTTLSGASRAVATNVSQAPFGEVVALQGPGGTPLAWPRDLDGRVSGYALGTSSVTLSRDAAGRIVGMRGAESWSFGYDTRSRLTTAASGARSLSYQYDASGNLIAKSDGATTTTVTVGAGSNRVAGFSYDAAGYLTGDGRRQLGYDARGRLTSVTVGASQVHYVVDTFGRVVSRIEQ